MTTTIATMTKMQLKKLASRAWTECYNNIGWTKRYKVEIDGEKDVILPILQELADDMNGRGDNCDFMCGVDYDDGKYEFYVYANENLYIPCYEYDNDDDDEEDKEVVAYGAELVEPDDPAPEDRKWSDVRTHLTTVWDDHEFWQNDHLCLALNWGNCRNEGRHQKTSEEDWTLFQNATSPYYGTSQEVCYEIYQRLCEERLKIYWNLEGESWESLKEAY